MPGRAEALPFEAEVFDKVVTVNTLYFWTDAATVLQECRRVLRPGGMLVMCFNSVAFLQANQLDRYGFKGYEVDKVEALLKGAGFDSVQTVLGESASNGQFLCVRGLLGRINEDRD